MVIMDVTQMELPSSPQLCADDMNVKATRESIPIVIPQAQKSESALRVKSNSKGRMNLNINTDINMDVANVKSKPKIAAFKKEHNLKKKTSLDQIHLGPKGVSESEMDLGQIWDIRSTLRLSKSSRTNRPAPVQTTPRSNRLSSLSRMFSTKFSKMSLKKEKDKERSLEELLKSLGKSLQSMRANQAEDGSNPLARHSSFVRASPDSTDMRKSSFTTMSEYKNLFTDPDYSTTPTSTSASSCSVFMSNSKQRRRKSTMPSPTTSPSSTPLERKLGYAGVAPFLGNAIAGSIRKARSMSFTNRREKGFLGYNSSRRSTFMKEFEMDAYSSKRSRSVYGNLPHSDHENEEDILSSSIEERRSDFERKARAYNFTIENLSRDRESYLAWKEKEKEKMKLSRRSSFRVDRENTYHNYNHLRSHSFTGGHGLPQISEHNPNKNNTTNDNIKRRSQRNTIAT